MNDYNPSIIFKNIENYSEYEIKTNWIELKSLYKANGNEKYILIGSATSMDDFYFYDQNISLYLTYFYLDLVELNNTQPLLCDLERGNVITPNGDGLNDIFEVKALYSNTSLYIFNRWGTQIYETNDYRNDWYAKDQAAGVYYYIFRRPNGDECKGVVTVIKD